MRPRARRSVLVLLSTLMALPHAGQALTTVHGNRVVTPVPASNTPHVLDGEVFAILPVGNRVYVGGNFTQVRNAGSPAPITRRGLFAFDAGSGLVDPAFVADFEGGDVEALAAAPGTGDIFVGGDFGTLNGSPRRKLARINGTTAAPAAGFSVSVTSAVNDVVVSGNRLIFAGAFSQVNGAPRGGLAAVSVATGALDGSLDIPFTAPRQGATPRVRTIAVSPDGTTLVAAGNFSLAAGQPRYQIALVDLAARPARVLDWQTSRFDDRHPPTAADRDGFWCRTETETFLRDVDFSPDGRYFVVVTTGWSTDQGPLCDAASRWETAARGSGLQPAWVNWTGGDTLTAVAVTDGVVYVGGHQRWLNNQAGVNGTAGPGSLVREGLAALDPRSGLPLPWNPGRERGEGVWSLVTTPQGLWVGSDTDRLGGAYHGRLAFLPLAGGSAAPSVTPGLLPADLYAIGTDQRVTRRSFNGSVLDVPVPLPGILDWSRVRAAFSHNGFLYTAESDGRLVRRSANGDRFEEVGAVNLRGISATQFRLAAVTGMFYDNGRLYYTLAGDPHLWYRSFLSEANVADDVVGAQAFRASGPGVDGVPGDGLDWSRVSGLALLSGKVYRADGADLRRLDLVAGTVLATTLSLVAPLTGAASRAVFLVPRSAAPAPAPPGTTPDPTPAPGSPTPAPPQPAFTASRASGYWMVGRDGTVFAFGGVAHRGDATMLGRAAAVDLEATPSANGYWVLDDAGRVESFGDARHRGDLRGTRLAGGEQATSLSATPTGAGYWIFTTKGRALAFGDAGRFGDLAAVTLNGPVVDSVRTPSGRGYYLVASDGGIFAFGDARFAGSMGDKRLNQPVQSLVPDPDGAGYWLVAADGGVFAFDAPFRGSLGSTRLNKPVTGMVAFGAGYLMVGADGGIFNFSDRPFAGSLGANPPAHPVVAVAGT